MSVAPIQRNTYDAGPVLGSQGVGEINIKLDWRPHLRNKNKHVTIRQTKHRAMNQLKDNHTDDKR